MDRNRVNRLEGLHLLQRARRHILKQWNVDSDAFDLVNDLIDRIRSEDALTYDDLEFCEQCKVYHTRPTWPAPHPYHRSVG